MGKSLVIRIQGGWMTLALIVLAIGALGFALTLDSDRIMVRVRNVGTTPLVAVGSCAKARGTQSVRLEPDEERNLMLFSGESHDDCRTWNVVVSVLDEDGKLIESRSGVAKDFAQVVEVGRSLGTAKAP